MEQAFGASGRKGMKMPPRVDLTGQRFGRLTVIEWGFNGKWLCQCDCGKEHRAQGYKLKTGETKSCGCAKADISREKATRHGMADSRVHRSWMSMRQRCENPSDGAYGRYGGRGIKVCERWSAFENFLADMGPMPDDCTLDRIDVNGDYEPSNCRWATYREQARNQRTNRKITHAGKTMCLAGWADELGIGRSTLAYRLKSGLTFEQAISRPVRGAIKATHTIAPR
ncbi:conserved hypothetical protein [Cupriavidus phytorum]|uniref:Uncharacterized protein n=1 Tax=Cupriavidus taiwanensis TaxID=164546 RepID=A0A975XBZ6_9BURK|nr:hypothetical protein [Cupriavidus taiwanensis]SOY65623.1 conserved hypothetical protein [Cupriavidus taiwanensis]